MNREGRPKPPFRIRRHSESSAIVDDPTVNRPVAGRLWQLRDRHGYFGRAEIEAVLGIPSPRGRWQCPGEFGPDGRWRPHCCEAAA